MTSQTVVDVGTGIIYRCLLVLAWIYLAIGVLVAWNVPELLTWANAGRFLGYGWLVWMLVGVVIDGGLRLVVWILSPLFEK